MPKINVPSFDYTAFYYPQIFEALIRFKRRFLPEHTAENPQDPFMQALSAFAVVGHLNNANVDLVANENTLPTARLTETVRNMLRLIDYRLKPAAPAQVTVIFQLTGVLATSVEVLPAFARVATPADADENSRPFEVLEPVVVARTDRVGSVQAIEDAVATDRTAEAASGGIFTPWATPAGGSILREGDSLVISHTGAQFTEISVVVDSPGAGYTGVWEYYDGNYAKATPTTVSDLGTNLSFLLTDYLGTADRRGTLVRVRLNETDAYEDAYSIFSGGYNIVAITGLLGQVVPSTDPGDYSVGSPWERMEDDLTDGTSGLTQNGVVAFPLPETLEREWPALPFNGVTGHHFRFRICAVTTPTSPALGQIRIDTGVQFVRANAVQGQFQNDEPLGSSTGVASQRFQGSQEHFVDGSETLYVDDVQWTRVENFLSSRPTDRHYVVELTTNDRPVFIFGDGAAGAIPTPGVGNIRVEYRYGAHEDGNVAARRITQDETGLTYVSALFNPRPATGWEVAQGDTVASLEQAKLEGPASLRVKDVATSPDDMADLITRARTYDATLIAVGRAIAIEEGFGPKTVELVVVPPSGVYASIEQLAALQTFMNGDPLASPPIKKRVVANQEAVLANYVQRPINLTVAVRGRVTETQVRAALQRILQPNVRKSDGVTYEWDMGGRVAMSRLCAEVFDIDRLAVSDVDITEADVNLGRRELPIAGTFTITVTP